MDTPARRASIKERRIEFEAGRKAAIEDVKAELANIRQRKSVAPKPVAALTLAQQRLFDVPAFDQTRTGISFLHTVMAQTCLPYKNPGDEVQVWQRENGQVRLNVATAEVVDPDTGKWVRLGLPFGPKARLMMAHFNSIALKSGTPAVDVGATVTGFISKILRMDTKGRNIRAVKDQLARLASCRMRFALLEKGRTVHVESGIVVAFDLWSEREEGEKVLWPKELRLSPQYFASLQRHAIPLNDDHLQALSNSALGLDIYTWLAQRLHRIKPGEPESITWRAVTEQFGLTYERPRKFRETFIDELGKVRAAYQDARIDLKPHGLILHHSSTPIPRPLVSVLWDGVERRRFPRPFGGA